MYGCVKTVEEKHLNLIDSIFGSSFHYSTGYYEQGQLTDGQNTVKYIRKLQYNQIVLQNKEE